MFENLKIIRKNVKWANLKVRPNLEVLLTVPLKMVQYDIEQIIVKRHNWINEKLEYFKKFSLPSKLLINGENFEYLGQSYILNVSCGDKDSVTLCGENLYLVLQDPGDLTKKHYLIDRWYLEQARHHFTELINKYSKIVNKQVNRVVIRKMRTRWGSCNTIKAYINLNVELIKKPLRAIEYVVLHELTHLTHYNHDRKFYNYMTMYMPDWQSRKMELTQSMCC
ncbi:MAG: M48 family metallopeptidase [Burkholderiales bacterium]|nr:M48 family metallopeptidase [Burkholderiales bacterium]